MARRTYFFKGRACFLNKPEPFEDKEFRDLWLENINRYATLNKLLEPLERAKQLFPEQKEFKLSKMPPRIEGYLYTLGATC
jgi:hypothetical protein